MKNWQPKQLLNGIEEIVDEAHENSTALCAICKDIGIPQICGKYNLNVHVKCSIEIEDQVICSRCRKSKFIKDQREMAKCG